MTETDTPGVVEIDCSAFAAEDARQLQAQSLADQVQTAIMTGDAEALSTLTPQLQAALDAPAVAAITTRLLTDAELAEQQAAQAAAIDDFKARKTAAINTAIAATDSVVVAALEAGTTVSKAIADYRTSLRALLDEVAAAGDIATVDAIEIPDPPTS